MLQTRIKNRLIRRGIVALALLAALPGTPVAATQTFDEAVAAYERGDYDTAMQGFRVHAEQGNAEAQLNLGQMYDLGMGVSKDKAEAVKWYRKVAEQGNAQGQYELGRMYDLGMGVPKDKAEAVRWYRKAGEQGHVHALRALAARGDYDTAMQGFRVHAERGNAEAQFNLGQMYDRRSRRITTGLGMDVSKDKAEAVKWYRKAALLHDSTAARVGALFQLLVQDTTAQDFGLPSSAIRLRM